MLLNQYSLYTMQNCPEALLVDEYQDFFNNIHSIKYISDLKDFFIENFPEIVNQNSQTLEIKNSNKKIVCTKEDGNSINITGYKDNKASDILYFEIDLCN